MVSVLRKVMNFFRRVFRSKGFRCTAGVLLGIFGIHFILSCVYVLFRFMEMGLSFRQAFSLLGDGLSDLSLSFGGISLGVIIGLAWYFRRKRKKEEAEKEAEEEAAAVTEPVQEEEIPEPRHYMYH